MTTRWRTGILIFDDVEVLDFAGPYEVLSRARTEPGVASRRTDATAPFQVFTVARTREPVRAVGGLQVTPDHGFADAPPIDLLVVPGGFGTRPLLDDAEVCGWIARTAAGARLVTSVCTGALLLAKAGLLRGRRATTHWGALELLKTTDPSIQVEHGGRFVDDGVMTSAGISAGIDLALGVVERVSGKAVADETAHYMEYRR
ncbi:MAG TPA: DJ-1/PfpI family protein [Kofleriaceae bacterium]|nr:DJ-1/PfpI family protein [Kofleriaceae bacterium]